MVDAIEKNNSIESFWSWFSKNERIYRNFQSDPSEYLDKLLSEIKKISNGLAIELEMPKDGIINMTISADGDMNLFPIVQQIIDKAPKVDGWLFWAFRQRISIEKVKSLILKVQDQELDPSKMKFFPIISGDILDIIIYTNLVTKENRNQIAYCCLMLLDNLLGEYDCVTKIHNYDFHTMPTDLREFNKLKPLLEIANYVDNFNSKK
jgi:hypothetical protein